MAFYVYLGCMHKGYLVLTFGNLLWLKGSNVWNPDIRPFSENPPGRPDKTEKEDVSGETQTYGNPI